MSKVSVIIPTRNVENSIGPLLKSIYCQDFDDDIEVLIQDSSDDRTPEIASEFPARIVRVDPKDYNYGKTRNEGAAQTDGEFLIFISADVEIRDMAWLAQLTHHFSDPVVAGVYGRQLPKPGATPMEQFFIHETYPEESATLRLLDGKIQTRGMVFFSNTNSAVRRSVWEQIGIPEMIKSEDQEWAKRAIIAGHKIVYDSEAAVSHSHTYSLKRVFQEYFDSGAAAPVVRRDGVVDYSFSRFLRDGFQHVLGQYRFMAANGYRRRIPYASAYDLAKLSGFLLGSRQRHMPLWMKKALCKKKNHWDSYSDVIREPV